MRHLNRREWLKLFGKGVAGAGLFALAPFSSSRAEASPSTALPGHTVNVRDFGAKGDGKTDDRLAIARAVAALPQAGGVLFFPAGTYAGRSTSPLLEIRDRHAVVIKGEGAGATTLRQEGPGDVIALLGETEITNIIVEQILVEGSTTAGKGIASLNLKDSVIRNCTVNGCRDHAIEISGTHNLNNLVSHCRVSKEKAILKPGAHALIISSGNGNRLEHNYFNGGGNPHKGGEGYETLVNLKGSEGIVSVGDIFDGARYAIESDKTLTVVQPYLDFTSPEPIRLERAFYPQGNASTVIIGGNSSDLQLLIHNPDNDVSDGFITVIGHNDGSGLIGAGAFGRELVVAAINSDVHDYDPDSGNPGSKTLWRLSARGDHSLTGIASGTEGQPLMLHNAGPGFIRVRHENNGSKAANRIQVSDGRDTLIRAGESVFLQYSMQEHRWRVMIDSSARPHVNDVVTAPVLKGHPINDWHPPQAKLAKVIRASAEHPLTISGMASTSIVADGGKASPGYILHLVNVGEHSLTLAHQHLSSTAPSRFISPTATDITLLQFQSAMLMYDTEVERWIILNHPAVFASPLETPKSNRPPSGPLSPEK